SAGPMGLQITALASGAGARVLVVEPIAERRQLARAFGAQQAVSPEEWRGAAQAFAPDGFAAAIVAIRKAGRLPQAIEAAAPGGRVVAFAGFGNEPAAVIDMNRIHYGEVELVGSHWVGTREGRGRATGTCPRGCRSRVRRRSRCGRRRRPRARTRSCRALRAGTSPSRFRWPR